MAQISRELDAPALSRLPAVVRDLGSSPIFVLTVLVTVLASTVVAFEFLPGEVSVSRNFQAVDWPWLRTLMEFGDAAGGKLWLFPFFGVVTTVMLLYRRRQEAVLLTISAAFYFFSPVFKAIVQRPRPDLPSIDVFVQPIGYSFPSGHAMGSGLIIGSAIVVGVAVFRGRPILQATTIAAGLAVLGIIGASRVYLGAHWTGDVFAGWILAAIFLMIAVRITARLGYGARTRNTVTASRSELDSVQLLEVE